MRVYLRTKFQVSSIILTSFRQGEGGGWREILPAPPPPPTPQNIQNVLLKRPPRLGLSWVMKKRNLGSIKSNPLN